MAVDLRFLPLAFALCTYMGCGAPAEKPEAAAADTKAIRSTLEEALSAFNRGDLQTYMAFHANDAIVLAPGRPPDIGREPIQESARKLFEGYNVREIRSIDEIEIGGKWAFVRGSYDSQVTPKQGGAGGRDTGKYIEILRKSNGKWQYERSIWNTNGH